jgi:hypothetical protein
VARSRDTGAMTKDLRIRNGIAVEPVSAIQGFEEEKPLGHHVALSSLRSRDAAFSSSVRDGRKRVFKEYPAVP